MELTKEKTIAELNDWARLVLPTGLSPHVYTPGVQAMNDKKGLLMAIAKFKDFTEENDPYGEHDFGSLTWENEKVFWKIDYYDKNLEDGAMPTDPDAVRMITVMLAEEY
jgi:hypothetical protein